MNQFNMATDHALSIRNLLASKPRSARQMVDLLGISQATVSRAIQALGNEVIAFGSYRSIQYALRRPLLATPDIPIYRVSPDSKIAALGTLSPVQPTGYVMTPSDGRTTLSEGFPWWLDDMRPQGFLGRAFVAAQASALGLPSRLGDWQEQHILHALLSQSGNDAVGNLILGEHGREHFLQRPELTPLLAATLPASYAQFAQRALAGETPASSAGGEQPKFAAYAETASGARHVLVKFTLPDAKSQTNPLTQRWRDLLLAEHHALSLLRERGIGAGSTRIVDHGQQRFLEVERFDRNGPHGRRGLISLSAMDAEFVGLGRGGWPGMTAHLAAERHISRQAHETACLLHAFGTLIGNTDMHPGNLSFITDSGRPYELAPAYDMLPMAFAPRASGELPNSLPAPTLNSQVATAHWQAALVLGRAYLARLQEENGFSEGFAGCIAALEAHLAAGEMRIARLG
ncbi:MAG: type II toxin-antitoxin system HipA family toxin YjjJ [Azonexus sp.]|nr:type II toxin-antitoxin system HipA family toxin YjjJ [Azonexus sp.]MDZ4313710.1 type II toxin-antitoxin system HipA family toxin YjjJ [Azonexus sp.]